MTISSINLAMGASSIGAYTQKLTTSTHQKLKELNIPHSENITEKEGKELLKLHKENNNIQSENNFSSNTKSNNLLERAQNLAKEIGIGFSDDDTLISILSRIETALKTKVENYKNNPTMLKKIQDLSRELANIQAQSKGSQGYNNTNQALMNSLELLSQYNKQMIKNG